MLALIPQKPPFLFVDGITELDEKHIVGYYRFKKTEFFYSGHFPNNPVTPGVILLEAMGQLGTVAFGIYLVSLEYETIPKGVTVLTDAQTEFFAPVPPGELVTIRAEKIFWRQKKIRSKIELHLENGTLAAVSTISGIGVLE